MRRTLVIVAAVIAFAVGVYAQEAQTTPPQDPQTVQAPQVPKEVQDAKYTNESVGRLSFVEGKVFVQRASDLGYEDGALNMPISEGDRISTTEGRAEVHFGRGNYIRLDNETKVDILNLPKKADDVARIRVWSGNVFLVVGSMKKEKGIELHTADSSFYVLDKGVYRVDVREGRDTEIQVYQGLLEVAGEEGSTLLKSSQRLEISEGRFTSKPSSFIAVANDSFDRFNESRTNVTSREVAQKRLPEELSDYEAELEEYGDWTYLPPYGNVWVPEEVEDDWRPYYDGRWSYIPLSGWTWWPYEPWGWATFHYGYWHWGFDIGWYWIPYGVWGPAWVNWWWDDWYFGWAPVSYWGYPGVCYGGAYYGHYYGPYYPHDSRALTVVRRDQLKDPHIAKNALKGDSLKSLNGKMSLTNKSLAVKPAGNKVSVQPLAGTNRVMLKNNQGTGLTKDLGASRSAARSGTSTGPRTIRAPDNPAKSGKSATTSGGTSAQPKSVKSPSSGGEKKATSSGSTKSGSGSARKKDGSPAASSSSVGGYRSDPSIAGTAPRMGSPRNANGYPSSPTIRRPASYGDSGRARAGSYSGPASRSSSGRSYATPSSGRSGGSPSRGARVGSSSSGKSSSPSRGSYSSGGRSSGASRSSGSSRSSSGGSRSSGGGGGVRRK